jgi:hypothetical protein
VPQLKYNGKETWEKFAHTITLYTMTSNNPEIFTATSAYSLAGVAAMAFVAITGAKVLLPKNARWQDSFTFIWLVRQSTCTSGLI